jgi:hypothetical protein
MRFVNNGNAERDLAYHIKISDQRIIRGNQDIKLQEVGSVWSIFIVPLVLTQDVAPNSLAVVVNAANQVSPAFEFTTPVFYGRERDYYQKRPVDLFHSEEMFDVAYNLDGLAPGIEK